MCSHCGNATHIRAIPARVQKQKDKKRFQEKVQEQNNRVKESRSKVKKGIERSGCEAKEVYFLIRSELVVVSKKYLKEWREL